MNILQLINVRWYNACAHYAITLSRALSERGHKVIVAGDPQSPPLIRAKELGLATYEEVALSYTSPWMIAYNVKRLVKLAESERIDIINAHRGEGHVAAALTKRLLKRGVPVVRTRGDVRSPKASLLNRWLNDRFTDKIITTCETLKQSYVHKLQLIPGRVVTIPVGIDHRYFSPREANKGWREKLNLPRGNPVMGMVGRLSPVKGHRHFIESAELVLKRFPLASFLICGADAQIKSADLKRMVEQKGIGKSFRFVGRVKDVRDIVALFDVGVVSSVGSETICRVALEYMSMGKPVVGTRVNAIPEVVHHDVNGLVVKPGNAKEMAEALIGLLEDESKRHAYGRNSRRLVLEKFTLDRFARKTEDVYLNLLN